MRAQIRVLECGTWESSSKAGQSPVPGDFPGGLLDQASQGAMAGLMRHLHEDLMRVFWSQLCAEHLVLRSQSSLPQLLKHSASWSGCQVLWTGCFMGNSSRRAKVRSRGRMLLIKSGNKSVSTIAPPHPLPSDLQLAFCTPCVPSLLTGCWQRRCLIRT